MLQLDVPDINFSMYSGNLVLWLPWHHNMERPQVATAEVVLNTVGSSEYTE